MTDIVERLRSLAAIDNCQTSLEAAAEIERLRAALEDIIICSDDYDIAVMIARATLAQPAAPGGDK